MTVDHSAPRDARRDPIDGAADAAARWARLGFRAYLWGYPAVITARTRDYATDPTRRDGFPPNTFSHSAALYTHEDRLIVKPNNDTVYSWAWVDLSAGPVTLTVPPVQRYHSFQLMDAYTNTIGYVGTRTTGSGGGEYLVVGPGDEGAPSSGATVLRSPTAHVWLLGRTLVDGPDDLAAATAIEESYRLTGPHVAPPSGPAPSPHTVREAGLGYFDELCAVLASDPPPARDAEFLAELAGFGIAAGRVPSVEITDPVAREMLGAAVGAAHDWLESYGGATTRPGWSYSTRLGDYGADSLLRAAIALRGLGAVTADEAVYPTSKYDADGERLVGSNEYVLRFAADELPPVDDGHGFWSITMYDEENFLVENPIDRYSIGDRTPGVVRGADGSLEIRISATPPADGTANWLPAPEGPFEVTMRCYLPTGTLLAGDYVVPALRRA
ncbi:DUF1254 domain-containing protein [Tsukamurella sp. 1534]|uniref:DUF1254 domain-containing protein n=1 Tax=Tsukamurella sp. 1534 TaxID=1151061 RepID=UPI0002DB4A58|nr:DUF1254 domain-containing protein [Tsukamurella sp. 1534]